MFDRGFVQVAVRKVPKAGVSASGDSLDVVERPGGGLTVIMADAQGSGPAAKRISNLVISKAANLISDGVRDGAVARAVHDNLYSFRGGQVVCTLTLLSIDLKTRTMVISRNGNAGVVVATGGELRGFLDDWPPIGVNEFTKPSITELPLQAGDWAAIFTDGIVKATESLGGMLQPHQWVDLESPTVNASARTMADTFFRAALNEEQGRPRDDMSLAVIRVGKQRVALGEAAIRSIDIEFPFEGVSIIG